MTKTTGKIIEISDETHDVKTFRIKLETKIQFIAGQYCLLSIGTDETVKKPFTFSNCPHEKGLEDNQGNSTNDTESDKIIDLTIKKTGEFTSRVFGLSMGDTVLIEGPFGKTLNFDNSVKEDIVFVAGGSGITPFISAIKYAIKNRMKNDITLLFSNRTSNDIIYKKELEEINKEKNISVVHILSSDAPEIWDGEKGRINKEMILRHVNNPEKKIWYACGPPGMMHAIKEILKELRVSPEKIRIEKWEIPGKHEDKA
jgi:glycine betaine catabolism B